MDDVEKRHRGLMAKLFLERVRSVAWRSWGRSSAKRKQEAEAPERRGFVRTSSSGGLYR